MYSGKIREMRKAAGITQEQLAKSLGINRATLSRYESGDIDPPSSKLQAIATALGVHIFDLTGIGEEMGKYVPDIEDISFPPDISPSEKARISELLTKTDVRALYDLLSDEEKKNWWKIGQDYKAEVEQVARDYDSLDQWGKQAVHAVISVEKERMRGTEGKDTTPPEPPPESP